MGNEIHEKFLYENFSTRIITTKFISVTANTTNIYLYNTGIPSTLTSRPIDNYSHVANDHEEVARTHQPDPLQSVQGIIACSS